MTWSVMITFFTEAFLSTVKIIYGSEVVLNNGAHHWLYLEIFLYLFQMTPEGNSVFKNILFAFYIFAARRSDSF